jgi:hypothetical protein
MRLSRELAELFQGWPPRRILGIVFATGFAGCGGSTPTALPTPAPTPTPCLAAGTSGTLSDRAGDVPDKSVSSPVPDLVNAHLAVTDCQLTVALTFAPGTLSRLVTDWQVGLDTDENPATGFSGRNSNHDDAQLMGADYTIVSSQDVDRGAVRSYLSGSGFTTVGTVPLVFEGDRLSFVVPLSLLGRDDGRLAFEANTAIRIGSGTSTPILDYLPDLRAALPRTR